MTVEAGLVPALESGSRNALACATVEAIKANTRIIRKELSAIMGITEDGIKFNLNKLKKRRIKTRSPRQRRTLGSKTGVALYEKRIFRA